MPNPALRAGLIAALMLLAAWSHNHCDDRGCYYSAPEQKDSIAKPIPVAIPTPPAEPKPDRDEWREEKDLQAQREMAQWAFWMLVSSSTGVIVTGVGIYYVRKTLKAQITATKAAAKQTKLSRKAMEANERPRLTVEIESTNWRPDFAEKPLEGSETHFCFRNYGRGAAILRAIFFEHVHLDNDEWPEPASMFDNDPDWIPEGVIAPVDGSSQTFHRRPTALWKEGLSDKARWFIRGYVFFSDTSDRYYLYRFMMYFDIEDDAFYLGPLNDPGRKFNRTMRMKRSTFERMRIEHIRKKKDSGPEPRGEQGLIS